MSTHADTALRAAVKPLVYLAGLTEGYASDHILFYAPAKSITVAEIRAIRAAYLSGFNCPHCGKPIPCDCDQIDREDVVKP